MNQKGLWSPVSTRMGPSPPPGRLCLAGPHRKPCTNVSPDETDDFIFGYTCVNDVTANDILNRDKTFAQ